MTIPGPQRDTTTAANQPTGAPTSRDQRVDRDMPGFAPTHGGIYPRWPLLAAIFMGPVLAIGYAVHAYYTTNPCGFGRLCMVDQLNGALQVAAIWLLFGLLWLLAYVLGVRFLEGPRVRDSAGNYVNDGHPSAHFLRTISDFGPTRWLLVMLGGVALAGVIMSALLGRLNTTALAFGGIVVVVGGCALLWQPDSVRLAARQPETAQEAIARDARTATMPVNVARSLPFIRGIFPRRTRQRNTPPGR